MCFIKNLSGASIKKLSTSLALVRLIINSLATESYSSLPENKKVSTVLILVFLINYHLIITHRYRKDQLLSYNVYIKIYIIVYYGV